MACYPESNRNCDQAVAGGDCQHNYRFWQEEEEEQDEEEKAIEARNVAACKCKCHKQGGREGDFHLGGGCACHHIT